MKYLQAAKDNRRTLWILYHNNMSKSFKEKTIAWVSKAWAKRNDLSNIISKIHKVLK
jgi:hypothetical protein